VCTADTLIKQQLSSLFYVRTVCNTREQQLNDGIADTDCVLPGVCIALIIFVRVNCGVSVHAYADDLRQSVSLQCFKHSLKIFLFNV